MKNKRKTKTLVTCIIMALIILVGQFVYAEVKEADIKRDLAMASDLAAISGLSDETVLKIYESLYSWDQVSENILVYRKILSFIDVESEEYDKVITYLGQYDPDDLLAIFEYMDANEKTMKDVEKIVKDLDKGVELETILSLNLGDGQYTVYTPASKEDIRKWLSEGYTVQNIIDADMMAIQEDMDLYYVLATYYSTTAEAIDLLITTDEAIDMDITTAEAIDMDAATTSEAIALDDTTSIEAIDLDGSTTMEAIQLTIKTGAKEEKVSAKDYKSLVNEMKTRADKFKKDKTDKILEKYGMDMETFEEYQAQGLNIHEIENAYRLAKKDQVLASVILSERLAGADWQDLISRYSKNEVKEDQKQEEISQDEVVSGDESLNEIQSTEEGGSE